MIKSNHGGPSRAVSSSQRAPHQKLVTVVRRHLQHPFLKPFAAHNIAAFEYARQWLAHRQQPLILDSFCGVGESTRELAGRYPQCAVLGLDKSAGRLARHVPGAAENYLLLRTDVDDFWRLAAAAGWRPQRHFLLYPNPWPKPGQLAYRIHGSAVFPALLQLGGELDLRSNWSVYVEEFRQALAIAGHAAACGEYHPAPAITPFERKYAAAAQRLWRCTAHIDAGPLQG